MSEVSVKDLAKMVGTPIDKLILQFKEAGIHVASPDEMVDDDAKKRLLLHLRKAREVSDAPQKITLNRKSTSQLKVASGKSRGSVVNVEVRKKRTYVKRSTVLEGEEKRVQDQLEAAKKSTDGMADLKAPAHQVIEVKADPELAVEEAVDEIAVVETPEVSDAESVVTEKKPVKKESKSKKDSQVEVIDVPPPLKEDKRGRNIKRKPEVDETEDDVEELDVVEVLPPVKNNENKVQRRRQKSKARRDEVLVQEEEIKEVLTEPKVKLIKKETKTLQAVHTDKSQYLKKLASHGFAKPVKPIKKIIEVPETLTVSDLANKMSIKAAVLIKALMRSGVMATINQEIDYDTAALLVEEMGHEPIVAKIGTAEEQVKNELLSGFDGAPQAARAPVVTIMGHVDHGKTSLLDTIRKTKVASGEAGGITQHIGAYKVKLDKAAVVFLDTPGHAAFTAMRARGSECTDIVVVVVAADDGVMPQTEEAIAHAKAAAVPMIVAINKIDKPSADPDRVKNELTQRGVVPEEWGGDTQFVQVSALEGLGIDELLDAILLQSEMLELKARDKGPAKGVVIESRLDKGRGPVATILVQEGMLKRGDILLVGETLGRVRALMDENGVSLTEAGPSTPVEILGLAEVPSAGDEAVAVKDERIAREVIDQRVSKKRNDLNKPRDIFAGFGENEKKTLNILLKADVNGSVEAITDSLEKLSNEEVDVKIIHRGVGGISESDVSLANSSRAIIVGFNVRADNKARQLSEKDSVTINYYSIIYDVIDEIRKGVNGLVAPKIKEQILGTAEVRDVFRSSKLGAIAGCMVLEGIVKRNRPIRVLRQNVVIFEGELESLRRFKDDAGEVRAGMECGIGVKQYNDVQTGDIIENFERIEVKYDA